ncbi:uncharacterized protein F5Z01DRAFT_671270 [Emericellopsis atlantica]|uniref:Uncharacterized protein n=1 Tax=Emericellopsis atlantica TaxID=2614577 RepID=A0A9P7ZST3_9HYPO|nr:uncharacterized protein F5Z01DRAFT_671270 [Emericellopsis atlantica]KAG9257678.1 hypothetical protein F5Z01DRAFT_671270 [Emericellopsis atlantica]
MYSSWGSSYGSYSSLSSTLSSTSAMDISPSPASSYGASCAFPSWPRRSSLDREENERPSSFLSDEELLGDPFEDSDTQSISSTSSSADASPRQEPTADELFQQQRERALAQKQYIQHMVTEKERKRQQARKAAAALHSNQRKSSPKKASHKTKLNNMTTITE